MGVNEHKRDIYIGYFRGLLSVLVVFSVYAIPETSVSGCRCLPGDDCWPAAHMWRALNLTVGGQLLASKPPAWPCHDPEYDANACSEVASKWTDAFWRASQPGAMQDAVFEMDGDKGCLPSANRSAKCYQGRVPVYTVNVTNPKQVQKAVRFASRHNLRIAVKNTGHDYLGRSNAPGSLSIWMHHLRDISFVDQFVPKGCRRKDYPPRSAVTIGAGVVWEELYRAADAHAKVIAGAQCTSVGAAGGYVQGAGHSPLAPTYGLSADNVLEFQVVTANGRLMRANACQNQDLFWALRGGGGGTFGIVTAVTHATHPPLENLEFASCFITANTSKGFQQIVTEFAKENVPLSSSGWGGFFLIDQQTLIIQYLLPNKNRSFAESSFKPFISKAKNTPGVSVNAAIQNFTSYLEWHKAVQCSKTGCSFQTGASELLTSRLIPKATLQNSPKDLAKALIAIKTRGYDRVMGYLVAGGKVSIQQENAVNPAWRNALWHMIIVKLFPANETYEFKQKVKEEITETGGLLRNLTEGSGCYLNEADFSEPDWQQAFFGANYKRLKQIKEQVDPNGLFVCRKCVGSEDWSEDLNCRKVKIDDV